MSDASAFAREHSGGVSLQVKVVPRASRNELAGVLGDRLKIKIAAPPVDSAANEELVAFLAKELGVPKSAVQLTHGRTSRNKTVFVTGTTLEVVNQRLNVGS